MCVRAVCAARISIRVQQTFVADFFREIAKMCALKTNQCELYIELEVNAFFKVKEIHSQNCTPSVFDADNSKTELN